MAASPEVMQANGGKPPAAPGGPQAPVAPAAGPMMSPTQNHGEQETAKLDCLMAQKMLERALSKFGPADSGHKAILKAITTLAREFGKREGETEELMPAEIKQLLQGLAGPGQPPKPAGPPPGAAPPGAGAPPPPPGAM